MFSIHTQFQFRTLMNLHAILNLLLYFFKISYLNIIIICGHKMFACFYQKEIAWIEILRPE